VTTASIRGPGSEGPGGPVDSRTDELVAAISTLLGADRRLRGRDHHRQGGLTYGELRCIAALGRQREMTAGQLARKADLTPATVTGILDGLEANGIVARSRSETDRRVCNVSLTPDGWELLARRLEAWRTLWDERLAGLSDEDIATATEVIRRAAGILDAMPVSVDGADPPIGLAV
jgi:DNA-binding MarR family transcriptional regulator